MIHHLVKGSVIRRLANAAITTTTLSLMTATSLIVTELASTALKNPLTGAAIAQTSRSDAIRLVAE